MTPPSSLVARILRVAGGSFLLWLAAEGFRSQDPIESSSPVRRASSPLLRGALAVLLNPGAWLFLGTVGTSLVSTAARHAHAGSALLAALALLIGVAIGDGALVVFGGLGLRRADARVGAWVRRSLAALLALLGLRLLAGGLIP